MVERGGLENRCGGDSTQGSNPCLSATLYVLDSLRLYASHPAKCGLIWVGAVSFALAKTEPWFGRLNARLVPRFR